VAHQAWGSTLGFWDLAFPQVQQIDLVLEYSQRKVPSARQHLPGINFPCKLRCFLYIHIPQLPIDADIFYKTQAIEKQAENHGT
jgi:hypothetical protein